MMDMNTEPPRDVAQSVDQIVSLEEKASARRTRSQTAVEAFVNLVGTLPFVLGHVLGLVIWIVINTKLVPGVPAFDPRPFNLLSTLLSFEGVLLVALVVMTQQRTSTMSDRRDHFDLQVNLLTERETTQILRVLRALSDHMGVEHPDVEQSERLAEPTSLKDMVGALHDRISDRPQA